MKFLDNISSSIRIGRIRYFNVAPVYYGFDQGMKWENIEWVQGSPAVLNRLMATGAIDISPVSSAAYAEYQDRWMLLPDLSISSFGKVMSVLLVSRHPMHLLSGKKVCITDESASAAALLKLILAHHQVEPEYSISEIPGPDELDPSIAGFLVIGDKAMKTKWHRYFPFVLDLGEIWRQISGLPFVYAVWAIRKQFAEERPDVVSEIHAAFLRSKIQGLASIPAICKRVSQYTGLPVDLLQNYYRQLLFDFDSNKKLGLQLFYDHLFNHGLIRQPVQPSFFEPQVPKVIYVESFKRIKNSRESVDKKRLAQGR